jgi:diguanylate cyclase (GGDEF)-like protein/PAS domain S-box-containing protein
MEGLMTSHEETSLRLIAEYSADVICRVSNDMRLLYVSPSCRRVLGWTPEEMLAMPPLALVLPEDIPALSAQAMQNQVPGTKPSLTAARLRRKDGTIIWLEVSPNLVLDPETGAPQETILVMRDITERKRLEEELRELAFTDHLTGLANRHAFDSNLDLEWRRSVRDHSRISLLLLDIDFFKQFNDQYGHLAGDGALRTIAAAVKAVVRATDTTARFGGDELAVILPSTDGNGALKAAAKVLAAVQSLVIAFDERPDLMPTVTVSIGSATEIPHLLGLAPAPEILLQAADSALYKAKREGRNRIATLQLPGAHADS